MSILYIAEHRKRVKKYFIAAIALTMVFMLLMLACIPQTALAGGIGDVVTEVSNNHFSSADFEFSTEDATGLNIKMHMGGGEYHSGYGGITVLGPADAAGMQAMLNYVTGQANHTSIQTKKMKGCEVRQYTMSNGVGVGVVLPDYFITVELYESGQSQSGDFQAAVSIAQQVLDGLERNGLLSQAAPDIESGKEADETETEAANTPAAVVTGKPLAEPIKVADTQNIYGVGNGPTAPTTFSLSSPHLVTFITTYHWNSAQGASPGTIALQSSDGKVYGPWKVTTRLGQGGVPNAYWDVSPNIVIPAGTYTIIDSDPASWSQNQQSGGRGMAEVQATPHFEVTSGSMDDLNKGTTGSSNGDTGSQESPAGVGAVGNIPGPSNTTEAIVGVAVPGLIATGLGALAGLGGGGFVPPAGTAPISPNAGGPGPSNGSYPAAGGRSSGTAQEVNQMGRRRRDEIYVSGPEADPGILIDTAEMNQDAITVQATDGIIIDTEEEAAIFVQPEPEIRIDTTDMGQGTATVGDGLIIDTADEAAIYVQPESGIIIDIAEEADLIRADAGMIIDTADETGVLIQDPADQPTELKPDASDAVIFIDAGTNESENSAAAFQAAVSETESAAQPAAAEPSPEAMSDDPAVNQNDEGDLLGIYDEKGFDPEGYDREGFDKDGYDHEDYDRSGFDRHGYDREGYNREGFDEAGYDREGFNKAGFNADGWDREGFNQLGFDKEGYNREGFNQTGYDREGFNKSGYNADGYNREGFNQAGFDKEGYNREGFDQAGYDREGFNREGFDKTGFDQEGFNRQGFDKAGYDREGFNQSGFNKAGYDREGFDKAGLDQEGFNRQGFDKAGYDREGFNQSGFDKAGYDREGFNKAGFDREGFNKEGLDKAGFDREGFNQAGFDAEGYDREGFNQNGFDREGYGRNGFNAEGFDREGFDVNGYNAKGYNRSGYNAQGYNAAGYDKEGFNKDGWDKDGYGRDGLNKHGFDREGYDQDGYDKDGYNREGYDREGRQPEGYDEDGYDKKGFNKDGFDRDGYDREGFDYEGYSRAGYDPWGYDKQGYGKDGYHWSGYNRDGYNRVGMHWSDNPYEGDSPFNVDTRNPFDGGQVIIDQDNYGNKVDLAGSWKPTKPPLGEPYPRTAEKYGAKPWTNEIPQAAPEKPAVPGTEDSGVIGPEDPMNTLKNHDLGQGEPKAPEGTDNPSVPAGEGGTAGTGLPIPEEDIPESGDLPQEPVPGSQPVSGPQHGDTIVLPGKDGRDYVLDYNSKTGEWENILTGGKIKNEDLESYVKDFNRWQDEVAEDQRQMAEDLKKMAARQDANSKAIDKNLADWKRLEQMQKAADKYNVGEKGGPGDVDKAIQDMKDDMLDGKEINQDKLERINNLIDNRIQGKTTADTGERWEEVPWYEDIGSALKANAATAKEVITGEKEDGSTSWLGMGARIMITAATGGGAQLVLDGTLTVAEAMYRIKDSIDKGESDFTAVSKAIGLVVLGEEMGWLAGAAGNTLMKEMMERFPAFTNKAADFIEKGLLNVMKADQAASKALGLVSKEGAEETIQQINKRLTEIGEDFAEDAMEKATRSTSRTIAGSGDDLSKGTGRTMASGGDDLSKGVGKSTGSGDDLGKGVVKSTDSGDDLGKGAGKSTAASGDDLGKGPGKSGSGSEADTGKGSPAAEGSRSTDGGDGPGKKADAPDGDGPGGPEKPSSGGDDVSKTGKAGQEKTLNTGAKSPEQVLSDPAAAAKAEKTVQNNVKDFDKLPPAKQQELIQEQAIYDEYRIQAEEKTWNMADKVQRGEELSVADVMEMKADPASMRTLKKMGSVDGLGTELGTGGVRKVQTEFNRVLDEKIYQPTYKDVKAHLTSRYNGAEIRVETVRTPGAGKNPWDINTDNDVIAMRKVNGPNGPEWVEIPKSEWEEVYNKSYAKHTGFNVDDASRRFPEKDWAGMDEASRCKEWAGQHEESPMDVFDPEAGRDFSGQRTWIIKDGDLPGRPMVEASPEEIARGVETVTIDGKQMRPASGYELTRRGEGTMLDPEQLGMMEKYKVNKYWNKGDSPAEIMKNQTESMEQLSKTAAAAQNIENSFRNMGYKVEKMPDNMQQAISVVNNNSLSPAARAARLKELGYDTPGDFVEKITSRIGAIRTARR